MINKLGFAGLIQLPYANTNNKIIGKVAVPEESIWFKTKRNNTEIHSSTLGDWLYIIKDSNDFSKAVKWVNEEGKRLPDFDIKNT